MTPETKTVILPLSKSPEDLLKEAFETQELIEAGRQHLEKLEGHLANIIKELVVHNIRESGNYELSEKVRTSRTVNVERFKERYPNIYDQLKQQEISRFTLTAGKTILIKDAEYLLGKDQLDPVCDLKTTTTHTILKKQLD